MTVKTSTQSPSFRSITSWFFLVVSLVSVAILLTSFIPHAVVLNPHNFVNAKPIFVPKNMLFSNVLNYLFNLDLFPSPSLSNQLHVYKDFFFTKSSNVLHFTSYFVVFLKALLSFYKKSLNNFNSLSSHIFENKLYINEIDFDSFTDFSIVAAETKNFSSFSEFYPFYLSQHEEITSRRLHVIGTTIFFLLPLILSFYYKNISSVKNTNFARSILVGTPINLFLGMLIGKITLFLRISSLALLSSYELIN